MLIIVVLKIPNIFYAYFVWMKQYVLCSSNATIISENWFFVCHVGIMEASGVLPKNITQKQTWCSLSGNYCAAQMQGNVGIHQECALHASQTCSECILDTSQMHSGCIPLLAKRDVAVNLVLLQLYLYVSYLHRCILSVVRNVSHAF